MVLWGSNFTVDLWEICNTRRNGFFGYRGMHVTKLLALERPCYQTTPTHKFTSASYSRLKVGRDFYLLAGVCEICMTYVVTVSRHWEWSIGTENGVRMMGEKVVGRSLYSQRRSNATGKFSKLSK